METVLIETRLNERDFVRFSYYEFYRKTYSKVLLFIGVLGLLSPLSLFFDEDEKSRYYLVPPLIMGAAFGLLLPAAIYRGAVENYRSTPEMQETIAYSFDKEGIHIVGETFESSSSWEKIHAVIETKSWFLIYHTPLAANILPKSAFVFLQQEQFRRIVLGLPVAERILC